MNVKVKIRRFNPEKDRRPYWSEFKVDAQKMDRVLDVLQSIKENQDGTITFRRSCAHGVCGSDAMVINGRNRLACKMLVQDVGRSVVIEPLAGSAGDQGPGGRHGAVLAAVQVDQAVHDQRGRPAVHGAAAEPRRRAPASTTRPSASCARPARLPARASGRTAATSVRRPSCRRTAGFSTTATRARRCAWRSWPKATACGNVARSTTARRPARATSRSRGRSAR